MRTFICCLLTSLTIGLAAVLPAASADTTAAQGQNITITPSSTNLTIAPGGTATGHFDSINNGTDDFSVTASVSPYHVKDVSYDPQFTTLPGLRNTADWIRLSTPVTRVLKSHSLTTYNYSVKVPAGTAPGGYYAVLFATTTPTNAGSGVVAHNRVGDILYITVSGPVKSSGFVTAQHIPSVVLGTGTRLSMLVGNNGGVHFYSDSTISVKNSFGKTINQFKSNHVILPGTQRLISSDWATKSPLGVYHISRSSSIPGGVTTLPDSTILVVQPWVVVVAIILVVLIIGLIVRRFRKH